MRAATVTAGVDIPDIQVVQNMTFTTEAALKLGSVLDLESDIAFSAETTEGYQTVVGDGFAFKYEPFGGEDGSNEYHFDPQYTATTWGDAFLDLAVTYRVGLLMEAIWVDELRDYLDGNRKLFDAGVNAIPGLASMPLEATYLAWVDFGGTGMSRDEFTKRVQSDAKIAVNHGPTFGTGGDNFLRFNIAAPRAQIEDAVARLAKAFGDLQ